MTKMTPMEEMLTQWNRKTKALLSSRDPEQMAKIQVDLMMLADKMHNLRKTT